MAKQRYVRTSFWTDEYIEELNSHEKLIFLYLLTNELTNICGIYEISIKRISFETGIEKNEVLSILDRFEKDWKVLYIDGYICIGNYIKHQSRNPCVAEGIKRELSDLPQSLTEKLYRNPQAPTGTNRQSYFTLLNLTLLNLTKPNHSVGPLPDQEEKITNDQKKREVKTRGKFWIGVRNKITRRNDLIDDTTFWGLQNFISDMTNEEFTKRVEIYKLCADKINTHKLSRFLCMFGKTNIQDFSFTDFVKKINLFGTNIDDVFKNIISKDYISKVLKMIHEEAKKEEPIKVVESKDPEKIKQAVQDFRTRFGKK